MESSSSFNKTRKETSEKTKTECMYPEITHSCFKAMCHINDLKQTKSHLYQNIKLIKKKNQCNVNTIYSQHMRESISQRKMSRNNKHNEEEHHSMLQPDHLKLSRHTLSVSDRISMDINSLFKVNYKNIKAHTKFHFDIGRISCNIKKQRTDSQDKEKEMTTRVQRMNQSVKTLEDRNYLMIENKPKMRVYVRFLSNKINEGLEEITKLIDTQNNIKNEMNDIHYKIKKLKKTREECVKYRNLLICIKEHKTQLPQEFTNEWKEEKVKEKKQSFNNLNSFSKGHQRKQDSKKKTMMQFTKQNTNIYEKLLNQDTNRIERYLDPNYPIFSSQDYFIEKLEFYDNEIIKMCAKYDALRNEIEQLKRQLSEGEIEVNALSNLPKEKALISNLHLLQEQNTQLTNTLIVLRQHLNNEIDKTDKRKKKINESNIYQECNLPLFRFNQLVKIKNFKQISSYVYYYTGNLISELYHHKRKLFDFSMDKRLHKKQHFQGVLKHLKNPKQITQSRLRDDCLYALKMLEGVILKIMNKNTNYRTVTKKQIEQLEIKSRIRNIKEKAKETTVYLQVKRQEEIDNINKKTNKILFKSKSQLYLNSKTITKEIEKKIDLSETNSYDLLIENNNNQSN